MGISEPIDDAAQQTHDVLLAFLRERSPELYDHMIKVGRVAFVIGRHLGMDETALNTLRLAAELHLVGKAAIPESILNKPGPLNDEEWKFMLRHTVVGERILMASAALRPVARLVRSCHEHWDGSGYPDGLTGPEIPLGARIVFVCDAFHAMTSDRPYYRARGVEEAIAELRLGSGAQFDPQVVDAFVQSLNDGELDARHTSQAPPGSVPAPA